MSQITKAMIQAGCEAQHRYRSEANEGEVRRILEAALASSSIQLFPSKEEIRRLAELALAEMQEKATTDREAWIASYEKVIMSYRRLALAKQQLADSAPPPLTQAVRDEAITQRAIAIICDEAEEMGYSDETISEFKAGKFDGDDLLTLQAVERALEIFRSPASGDCVSGAAQKLKLWFFRDLSDDQRLKLFGLFSLPVDEIGKVHGFQSHALRHVIRALATATKGSDE